MNTRIGVVIDGLVTTWTTALTTATVIDGPARQKPNIGDDTVYVGWDGGDDNEDAASANQEWAGLGNKARNENITITCYAEATRGDDDTKPTRDACLALVQAAEAALRTDPSLGGALSGAQWAAFGEITRLAQPKLNNGTRVGAVFTVTAFARI